MTPRWVVVDATGRELITYVPAGQSVVEVLSARVCADWKRIESKGHWNYDRCVIEGASDLGRVTVDGAQ